MAMGIMKIGNAGKYWSLCNITKLDFFGKYMSRNGYQMLLSNYYCSQDYNNPPKGAPSHDLLHKIRPLVDMCQKNLFFITDQGNVFPLMRVIAHFLKHVINFVQSNDI